MLSPKIPRKITTIPWLSSAALLIEKIRASARSIVISAAPECDTVCLKNTDCPNLSATSKACKAALQILSYVDDLDGSLQFRESFSDALRRVESMGVNEGDELSEFRRYRIIDQSLILLREYLQMDFAGIYLFKEDTNISVHQSGNLFQAADWNVINGQISEAVQKTSESEYAYLCPSDSKNGGIDAIFIFRDISGEPIGCLLLDDHNGERRMENDEVTELVDIFYDRLRSAIREEEIRLAKKEIIQIRRELEEIRQKLEYLRFDSLTGVFGRRYGEEQFAKVFEGMRRSKETDPVASVAILDIDHFKTVNDTYGHDGWDRVLKGIGDLLKNGYHPENSPDEPSFFPRMLDVFYRYGGEEFVFIFPQTDIVGALIVTEKIRRILSKLAFSDGSGGNFSVTATIGVVEIHKNDLQGNTNTEAMAAALKKADTLLYHGKLAGRNRVVPERYPPSS